MVEVDGVGAASRRELTAELLRAYRETGDRGARRRLIELHLPLVRALARRYVHRGERLEDLVQVGSVGLIEAIDRFDPEKGGDLASFAVPTITGEIKNHLRDRAAVVRIPRRVAERDVRLRAARASLSARLCRPADAVGAGSGSGYRRGRSRGGDREERLGRRFPCR